jgi:hypothetical protein
VVVLEVVHGLNRVE